MNLTDTTHTLELVTAQALSTDYSVSWTDVDKSGASTAVLPGSSSGNIVSATTTTLVGAPGASVYRAISHLSVFNAGVGTQTLTVQRDVSGDNRISIKVDLATGDSLHYERGRGFYVMSAAGELSLVGSPGADGTDGAVSILETEIDFGASSTDVATKVVADAGISSSSKFLCSISGGSTADNNSDAHALMARECAVSAEPSAGSVTFTARLFGLFATGTFKLRYVYS